MNSLKNVEALGVALLNFEGGTGVLLLSFRGSPVPLLNFERSLKFLVRRSRGPRSRGPSSTLTPCQLNSVIQDHVEPLYITDLTLILSCWWMLT